MTLLLFATFLVFLPQMGRKLADNSPFLQPCFMISAPRITKDMFQIEWSQKSATEVFNQFRALSDISKLHSYWQDTGETVRFDSIVHPSELQAYDLEKLAPNAEPGQAFSFKRKGKGRYLCIKCRKGWVAFKDFYYGPRKIMSPSDFYAGFMSKRHRDKNQFFIVK